MDCKIIAQITLLVRCIVIFQSKYSIIGVILAKLTAEFLPKISWPWWQITEYFLLRNCNGVSGLPTNFFINHLRA